MANTDLVEKILALQAQIDTAILPSFDAAKTQVDSLQKELDALSKLPKITKSQGKRVSDITTTELPAATQTLKDLADPAKYQQKVQASFDDYHSTLLKNLKGMTPGVSTQYSTLETAAFSGGSTEQQAFKDYVGQLQRVPYENVNKLLRSEVQAARKAGTPLSLTDFATRRRELETGEVYDDETNPENIKQLANMSRRGPGRLFNRENFNHHWNNGGATAIGYSALSVGQEAIGVADTYLDGRRYTQEARERALLGLAPGIGGMIGAGIGAFSPVGPIGGSLIGGGVGTAIEGVASASSERSESIRLASEQISLQMGRGTQAAGKFADILDETSKRLGVPAQELALHSAAIANAVTGFGKGGVELQGRLSASLGDNYARTFDSQIAYSQTPFSRPYRDMLAGSTPADPNLFGDAAFYFAFTGDADNLKKSLAQKHAVSHSKGVQQYRADVKTTDAPMSPWDELKYATHRLLTGADDPDIINREGAKARSRQAEKKHAQEIKDAKQNDDADTTFYYSVLEGTRKGRETAAYGQTLAQIPYQRMQQALASGQGLAGLKRYSGEETTDLQTAYSGVVEQEDFLNKRLADPTLTGDRRKQVKLLLAQTKAQALDIHGQAQDVRVGLFQQGVSERQGRFEGGLSRLEIGSDEIMLGGFSSFDPRARANAAAREGFLNHQAQYDLNLANDKSNFLTPQEREIRRTAAKQEQFQADFLIPNTLAQQHIQDTVAASNLRQADVRVQISRGQATGDITNTLTAQNALVAEQLRLQGELKQRLAEGNLSYQQRTQLAAQIKDIEAQTITAQRQAYDTAITGFQQRAEAQSSTGYSQQERAARLRGTSRETLAMAGAGYDASLQSVALARVRMLDPTLSPDQKLIYQAQYEQAKNSAEQQGIDAFSNVQMSPEFDTREIKLQAKLSRQMRSPFEPGNVLATNSELAKMGEAKLGKIDEVMKSDMARQDLTKEQKQLIYRNLTQQKEDTRNDIFERQQSVDVGWIDRLVSMSVNAPSFAARLMPGSDRVASIAEKRGLGSVSARVFGFHDRQSYRDAETMGVLPSEMSRFAFGQRPGDFPMGDTPDAPIVGGKGTTIDSIDSGGMGAGVPASVMGDLNQTLQTLSALLSKGLQVTVNQINPDSAHVNSTAVNASSNYDAKGIMRGGVAPGRY